MSDIAELARTVADTLAAYPDQKWMEIDTRGMNAGEILSLIDAVHDACCAAGIALKGVKVDPMQVALPAGAPYENAFVRGGRLVIVDLDVDDMVVVRRR